MPSAAAARPRSPRGTAALLAVVLGAVTLLTCPALAGPALADTATATPATPDGLGADIEAAQPYIGQSTCDPVAKPGVVAFRDLLLATYPDTGSLGIVQNCGVNGQSEHKEGRAFDWAVSVDDPQQVAEVNALMAWLQATDGNGNTYAMAKRLGIMYMIWNHQMWRSYSNSAHQANHWDPYSGVSGHTDHVHFSFGWNGAEKATSYWTGTVAPVYTSATDTGPAPTPGGDGTNRDILRRFGQVSLAQGDTGDAVQALQTGLGVSADGDYGPITARAVSDFQSQHGRPVTGTWGPDDWAALFPVPGDTSVTIDGGTLRSAPVDSTFVLTGTAAPHTRVRLHFHPAGWPAGDFGLVRTVTSDAAGAWRRPITASKDYRYFATVGDQASTPVLTLATPTVDGTVNRVVTRGARCTLTGQAVPGSQVELRLHRAGTPAADYGIVRPAAVDEHGRWSFTYRAGDDYRFYVLRAPGAQRLDASVWLVQAR